MKYLIPIIIFLVQSFNLFSQITIKLGSREENVYPFDLNQNNLYFDWAKSKNNLKDIEVFGMGEATHGTKEFFEIKSKTFKYLVTNFNYKVFGIEAYYGECNYINDYVNSDFGNIDTVMLNFSFWAWRTKEVKDLILWIKEYNQQHTDSEKIKFYGFDMLDIYSPVKYLVDYLKSDKSIFISELGLITKPVLSKSKYQIFKLFNNKDSNYRDTLVIIYNELNEWLKRNEYFLTKKYSTKKFEQLHLCILNFGQAINNTNNSLDYRDSCMASNIFKIHNLENSKMFIWAHNEHINIEDSPSFSGKSPKPMGGLLKKGLGPKYYSVGFIFNKGNFHAIKYVRTKKDFSIKSKSAYNKLHTNFKECSVPEYKKNNFTSALSSANLNTFFIDINSSSNSIFTTPLYTYNIGALFTGYKRNSMKINAKKQFDGLIYINNTTSATPLK